MTNFSILTAEGERTLDPTLLRQLRTAEGGWNVARCYGAEDQDGAPICEGEDVQTVWFLAPGDVASVLTGEPVWHKTGWCAECRAIAMADGYVVVRSSPPAAPARIWTAHRFECRQCRRVARASYQGIAEARWNAHRGEAISDAEIVREFDLCLSCLEGLTDVGEHVAEPRYTGSWHAHLGTGGVS
jgi:hypothetical protein